MPFTLAHPAAVLPLMRRPFVGLALVCGAMAPDIPYYVRATRIPVTAQSWYEPFTNASTSHSAAGVLPVTMPLALLLYLLLVAAAPPVAWLTVGRDGSEPNRGKADMARTSLVGWLWILVSLGVGVLSHLLWDSATSSDGFVAGYLDVLNEEALLGLSWTSLMQHASTVIGLVLIAVVLWNRRGRVAIPDAATRRRSMIALAGVVAVGLLAGTVAVLSTLDLSAATSARDGVEMVLATAAMGGGAAAVVLVALGVSCWWLWRLSRRLRHPDGGARSTH